MKSHQSRLEEKSQKANYSLANEYGKSSPALAYTEKNQTLFPFELQSEQTICYQLPRYYNLRNKRISNGERSQCRHPARYLHEI